MKILIISPVAADAVEILRHRHEVICAFNAPQEEIKDKIAGCDVLVFRSGPQVSADVLERAPQLRLLIRAGSGLDNLDIDYVNRHGIELQRIEQPGARAVAELSFCLMLALARQLRRADATLREGHWQKHAITGYLLAGKTLGIYGAGNIGSQVGKMGAAWGMQVIGCVENPTGDRARELQDQHIRLVDADTVLADADFLSIHLPLKPSTRNLIDAAALARVKPGAFLVNLARGGVVNEAALRQALLDGRLAGAGLDVHEREGEGKVSPLAELDNVLLTPHVGAGTIDTQREIGKAIVDIVAAHAEKSAAGDGDSSLSKTRRAER